DRRSGVAVGLGLALMAAIWTLAALMGLEAVFLAFPWAYALVKFVGAMYLIHIAYRMWMNANELLKTDVKPAAHAVKQGFMINVLNPKSALFAAAMIVVIFPSELSMPESLLIVANQFFIEALFYAAVAFGMSRKAISQSYLSAKVYIDRISAGVLSLLGLRIMFHR
ncbi:MAG: LysE family translocator, partial [Paracoccaceae bacterium]